MLHRRTQLQKRAMQIGRIRLEFLQKRRDARSQLVDSLHIRSKSHPLRTCDMQRRDAIDKSFDMSERVLQSTYRTVRLTLDRIVGQELDNVRIEAGSLKHGFFVHAAASCHEN